MTHPLTPAQTVGPFFSLGLSWLDGLDAAPDGTPGSVVVGGRVFDGAGDPVADAVVESWQANPQGFGRHSTDEAGRWMIRTRKPGAVPGPNGRAQAPHVNLSVFARGLLDRVVTRLYFPDEEAANAADPVLGALDPQLRHTLIATAVDGGYQLDIHLQGPHETVFFTV